MSAYRSTFISHAHADNALCDRYVAALRAHGVELWYDRENAQNGHLLGDVIQHELERRAACVVLLTQHALDSFWVNLEIQTYLGLMAKDRSRVLLPVRIGPCTVPSMLNAFLWIDALDKPFERAIEAIATALDVSATVPDRVYNQPIMPSLPVQPGPAPAPPGARSASHLTPMPLYNLGFRGWESKGVECILPPLCPVPGGIFSMGSDKTQDQQALDNETPQYPIEVASFSIGQHPVTVAEYACAMRAEAVPEWPFYGASDWKTQLRRLDHPVVDVSWRDALAYTRWLAQITGQPWRLPSEAEWEKAARWDAARQVSRIYPWGDAFDKKRCKTRESWVKGTTTPVGRYPSGASPCGAQDMAGNVWEWTSSLRVPYPYRQNDGREVPDSTGERVLRGGAWVDDASRARTAYRSHGSPGNIGVVSGIRLACSAPAGA